MKSDRWLSSTWLQLELAKESWIKSHLYNPVLVSDLNWEQVVTEKLDDIKVHGVLCI